MKITDWIRNLLNALVSSLVPTKFVKFLTIGTIGACINLVILYSLTNLGLHYMVSGFISIETAILFDFFLNRAWTFKEESRSSGLFKPLIKDHIVRSGGLAINLAFLWVLTEFLRLFYIFSMIIGILIATAWNFLGNAIWVWPKQGRREKTKAPIDLEIPAHS